MVSIPAQPDSAATAPLPPRTVPRSLLAFAALAAGFFLARDQTHLPASLWFSIAGLLCAAAGLTRAHACRAALFVAALCFGAGWFTLRLYEPAPHNLRTLLAAVAPGEERPVTLRGVVLTRPHSPPRESDPLIPFHTDDDSLRFDLAASALESDDGTVAAARGRVHIRLAGLKPGSPRPDAGDRLRLTGLFRPVAPPMNPGEADRRLLAWQEGFAGTVHISGPALLAPSPEEPGAPAAVYSQCLAWRAALTERAHTLLLGGAGQGPGRALLGALILGEEEPALREVRGAFMRLGLAHVLAISGFHIAVMAGVVLFALRAAGDLGRLEPILVAALVLAYLAVLPFEAPVWRSALMVLGLLSADALGRRHNRISTLGWIAVALLLYRPLDLWSLGFQLSFGLVALLIWLGERAHWRFFTPPLRGTVTPPPPRAPFARAALETVKRLFSTNLLCCAAATPLIALRTGLVSPASLLAGMLLIPPITLLMIAAYAALALGLLVPQGAAPASAALDTLAAWAAWLVQTFDRLPGASLRIPAVSLPWTIAATALILYWFAAGPRFDRRAWIAAGVVIVWLGAELALLSALPRGVALRVDTLAVGDGTCQIVRCGRSALLWDCGSMTPGVGRAIVPRAARALGAWRTPVAVITHPNLDHFNGLLDVLEPLGVRTVLIGEAFAEAAAARPRSPEAYVLDELRRRGVEVRIVSAGATLPIGDATLEFLSPPPAAPWPADNDRSLVARITPAHTTERHTPALLLTGDIQDWAIAHLRQRHPRLHAEIVEAPHHGSARQPAVSFLADLQPRVVLQSTGPKRARDPIWDPVRQSTAWRCTATTGAAWAEITSDGSVRSGAFRDEPPR